MPRRFVGTWSIACLVLSGAFVHLSSASAADATSAAAPATCQRPFTADSPWNTPIVNPVYSPDNDAHIRAISTDGDARNPGTNLPANDPLSSDSTQYTFPVYYITNATPRVTVRFETWFSDVQSPTVMHNYRLSSSALPPAGGGYVVAQGDTDIPANLTLSDERGVPVPPDAVPSAGSDAQLILINSDTGEQWGFTNFHRDPGTGRVSTASLSHYNTAWSGVPPRSSDDPRTVYSEPTDQPFVQIGAGIPPLAGLIRPCEVTRAVDDPQIDDVGHALQFGYDYPARTFAPGCNPDPAEVEVEQFLPPASKSDGSGCYPDVLEGTRLQLDPAISDATILNTWNCRDACFVIAKTLQVYGMYTIDESGRPKVRAEYEQTAKWTSLEPRYRVVEKTVSPIPLTAFKVIQHSDTPEPESVSIRGRITDTDGRAMKGVLLSLRRASDGAVLSARTNARGFYRFRDVLGNESYVLTPSRRGYSFAPESRSFVLSTSISDVNFVGRRN